MRVRRAHSLRPFLYHFFAELVVYVGLYFLWAFKQFYYRLCVLFGATMISHLHTYVALCNVSINRKRRVFFERTFFFLFAPCLLLGELCCLGLNTRYLPGTYYSQQNILYQVCVFACLRFVCCVLVGARYSSNSGTCIRRPCAKALLSRDVVLYATWYAIGRLPPLWLL